MKKCIVWIALITLPLAIQAQNAVAPETSAKPSLRAPALLLAHSYRKGTPLAGYWVSEKYDGVRGYWDGKRLMSRGGHPIATPAWFTKGWPATPLDGELWAGHGQFAKAQSATSQDTPLDANWRQLRFMVFDLPAHAGSFDERLPALQAVVAHINQPWVQAATQTPATTHAALMDYLRHIEREGGEGLMLHHGSAPYRAGRSNDLLKVKSHEDAEAMVIAHLPGKGRLAGQTGALLVQMPGGQRFKLGAGLSDIDRKTPPAVGSWVTYRYRGNHPSGLPRFASFWRSRSAPP